MKFLVLIFFVAFGGIANGCNLDGILQCWSQSSIAKVLEKFSSEASLRTLNAQYAVEEYCSAQSKLEQCIGEFRSMCPSGDTLTLDTAISAGKFLCSEGKQDFVNHFHCLMSTSFQTNTQTCMSDVMELTTNVSNAKVQGQDISKEKCRSADRAFECIEEKTSVSCGETAKEFIHHYVEATLQPLMKDVTCNHSHTSTETSPHPTGTCSEYCYKYPESSDTPVLESTKRNMDGWCTENCRLGNCPPTLCTCDCRVPTQVLVCKPDSSKFGPRDDGVKWCLNTCRAGHCPRDYCQCHILYRQQPRPVTEGL